LRDIYVDSLAVGGESGTLGKRFNGTNLHDAVINAKSGFIDGVSTLSGFVTMPDGSRRAFSVLVNGFQKGQLWRAKALQERVVALIADDMASNVSITLGSD
jgi:D-alanyl-D-alanine carboxypeptidase/D-alanyl-D-alanine-endopeptidase (penicillin-binding protein 4)